MTAWGLASVGEPFLRGTRSDLPQAGQSTWEPARDREIPRNCRQYLHRNWIGMRDCSTIRKGSDCLILSELARKVLSVVVDFLLHCCRKSARDDGG